MINHGDRENTQSANAVNRVIMNKSTLWQSKQTYRPSIKSLRALFFLFDVNYSGDKESLKYGEAASIPECGIKYIISLIMQVYAAGVKISIAIFRVL